MKATRNSNSAAGEHADNTGTDGLDGLDGLEWVRETDVPFSRIELAKFKRAMLQKSYAGDLRAASIVIALLKSRPFIDAIDPDAFRNVQAAVAAKVLGEPEAAAETAVEAGLSAGEFRGTDVPGCADRRAHPIPDPECISPAETALADGAGTTYHRPVEFAAWRFARIENPVGPETSPPAIPMTKKQFGVRPAPRAGVRWAIAAAILLVLTISIAPHSVAIAQPSPPPEPAANDELQIVRFGEMPDGRLGISYEFLFGATGGQAPYTKWEIIAGKLPSAMILDSATGKISGIPREMGEFRFTLRVTDSAGRQANKTFTLRINGNPFELTEMAPPVFDGEVQPETEYAGTAPHSFRISTGEMARVYVRQAGGVLHVGFIVPEAYIAENAVRVAITTPEMRRIYGFLFNPFNPARRVSHNQMVLPQRPSGNQHGQPNWVQTERAGFIGKANAIHAGNWHAELKIALSPSVCGIQPGRPGQSLLIGFAVIGADSQQSFSPPMVPPDRNPTVEYGFFARASYFELTSRDNFGAPNPAVLPTPREIADADNESAMIFDLVKEAAGALVDADRALDELRVELDVFLRSHGENPPAAALDRFRARFDALRERREMRLSEYAKKIELVVGVNKNYYAQLNELANYFAKLGESNAEWEKPLERWQAALYYAQWTWRLNPSFLPARILVGRAQFRLGMTAEALRHYLQLQREYPRDPGIVLEVARMRFAMATQQRQTGAEIRAKEAEARQLVEQRNQELRAARDTREREKIIAAQEAKEKAEADASTLGAQADDMETAAAEQETAAMADLDDLAAFYHEKGTVPLACAALLYAIGRAELAPKYLLITRHAALNAQHTDTAVKLVLFLAEHRQIRADETAGTLGLVETVAELAPIHGDMIGFCLAVANTFTALHMFEHALEFTLRAAKIAQTAPRSGALAERDFIESIGVQAMTALARAGQFERAAELYRQLLRSELRRGGPADQEVRRWADIEHYPRYAEDEAAMRERDAKSVGTETANPRLKFTFRHPTDPTGPGNGEVIVELFRQDVPELVDHVLGAIRGKFYSHSFTVEQVVAAHHVVLGVGGQTADAPRARAVSGGRMHFRGNVGLVPLSVGEVGLPMAFDTGVNPWLNHVHPVVGRVVSGMDVVDGLAPGVQVTVEILP